MGRDSLTGYKAQSHVGQSTEQSIIDQSSLYGVEQFHMGQSRLIWDRADSYGTEQTHMGQSRLMLDRAVSKGTEKSYLGHT